MSKYWKERRKKEEEAKKKIIVDTSFKEFEKSFLKLDEDIEIKIHIEEDKDETKANISD